MRTPIDPAATQRGGPDRRHLLSFLSPDAAGLAQLARRAAELFGEGSLVIVADRCIAGGAGELPGATVLKREDVSGDCRIAHPGRASGPDILIAACPDLWMTETQRREADGVIAAGGALFVHVARTGDAARAGLKRALAALGRRVRLHEFSAVWSGDDKRLR